MDFSEPEHIRLLREMMQKFVAQVMPRDAAARWDKHNEFPRDVFAKLAETGVMGLTVSEEYGGSGRDIVAAMAVIEELSKRSMAVAIPYIMAACYAGMNLADCGSDEQKEKLLPEVAAGKLMFAYGWSEPDIGADLANVKTTARLDGASVLVNGAKRFCTGAEFADYIYTLVRSDSEAPKYQNLSLLLIPIASEGVRVERMDMLGLKGATTTDVTFSDVRVSRSNVMGGPNGWNNGWQMITGAGLDVEKLEVAAMALGIAEAASADASAYSEERRQFGAKIVTYQTIRHKLADIRTRLHAARLTLRHAAWLSQSRIRCGVETSMTKLFVTETAKDVVLQCLEIFGAYGYSKDFDVERYLRDVLVMPIIGGSSAIQRNNIANWSGLARS
jgi:acyl-CoA dehydrogenase